MRSLTKITFSVQHYQFLRLYYTVPQDVQKCPWLTFDLRACLLTNSFLCLPPQKNDAVLSAPFSTCPSLLSSRSQALSRCFQGQRRPPSSTGPSPSSLSCVFQQLWQGWCFCLLDTFLWAFIPFHAAGFPATSPAASSQYRPPMTNP